eukprot:1619631-Rhodomonas_salina.2
MHTYDPSVKSTHCTAWSAPGVSARHNVAKGVARFPLCQHRTPKSTIRVSSNRSEHCVAGA